MNNALNGFKFTKAGNEACITHLFHKIIPNSSKFVFKINIISICRNFLGIGIIDYEKHRQTRTEICNNKHSVCYYTANHCGYKYPGNIIEGTGFRAGEIVVVTVNLV